MNMHKIDVGQLIKVKSATFFARTTNFKGARARAHRTASIGAGVVGIVVCKGLYDTFILVDGCEVSLDNFHDFDACIELL